MPTDPYNIKAPGNEKRHGWIYPVADDGSDAIEPGVGDIKDEVSEALEKRLDIYPNTYHSTDEVNDGEYYLLLTKSSMLTILQILS